MTDNATEKPAEKLVPEKDLLAVKEGAELRVQKLTEEFTAKESSWKSEYSKAQDEIAKARAEASSVSDKLKAVTATAEQLNKTTAERDVAAANAKIISDKFLSHRLNYFTKGYGIPEEKVKGKTHEQLDVFEEALAALGKTANFSRMDSSSPPAGGGKLSPLEAAKLELKHAELAGTGKMAD
jgi:hypothetical protein